MTDTLVLEPETNSAATVPKPTPRWRKALRRVWRVIHPGSTVPSRLRTRKKILLCLVPFQLFMCVVIYKFAILVPSSHRAATAFNDHNIAALQHEISQLRFLFSVDNYLLDFADGDLSALQSNLNQAEQKFTAALNEDGQHHCESFFNLLLIKETIGDLDIYEARFSHAMQESKEEQKIISASPPGCILNSEDTNPQRQEFAKGIVKRLNTKYNQADQGTLSYSDTDGVYNFYYELNPSTNSLAQTGTGNRCAGLADGPKKECIIKHNPPKPPPPKDSPKPDPNKNNPPKDNKNNPPQDDKNDPPPPQSPPPPPPPEKLPPTKKHSPVILGGKPEEHKLNPNRDPGDALGDLLSNGAGKNHDNQ